MMLIVNCICLKYFLNKFKKDKDKLLKKKLYFFIFLMGNIGFHSKNN